MPASPESVNFFDVDVRIVTDVQADEVIALYVSAGWWDAHKDVSATIPLVVKGSFRFAGAFDKQGKLIGMGRVISDGVSDAYIQDVVVLPEYRGKGIGSRIIQLLIEECRAAKIVWLGLIGEPGTENFYRKLGFVPLQNYQPYQFRFQDSTLD